MASKSTARYEPLQLEEGALEDPPGGGVTGRGMGKNSSCLFWVISPVFPRLGGTLC